MDVIDLARDSLLSLGVAFAVMITLWSYRKASKAEDRARHVENYVDRQWHETHKIKSKIDRFPHNYVLREGRRKLRGRVRKIEQHLGLAPVPRQFKNP